MNKKEFARRAMEIVEICIEKDISFGHGDYWIDIYIKENGEVKNYEYLFGIMFDEKELTHLKKLVEEY